MAVFTPTVRVIVNGEAVDAAVTNGPIADLTQRTDWLKEQINALVAGGQLVLRAQACLSGVLPGMPVYFDDTTNTFKPALADISTVDLNRASATSYWQGVAFNTAGTVTDVCLGGVLPLTALQWAAIFEDGIVTYGDIFLSEITAGKITVSPGDLGVYIGHLRSDNTLLVRLGSVGSFLEHVHYQRFLVGAPAGTVVDPAFNAIQVVTTPNAALQGWLPATPTYFAGYVVGVQIPTGAKFGYNIQNTAEADLREVFPVVPVDNAQLAQSGVIISTDTVVLNNYGIWWMDDTYGNAPWPVDYNVSAAAAEITLWTTRIIASASLVSLVETTVLNDLASGGIDPIAVARLFSADANSLGIAGTYGSALTGWRGAVTLINLGVTAFRPGRGISASGPSGDATLGWKGLIDAAIDLELPATHLWTEQLAVGDKLVLLTTNGAPTGTVIGLRGHRLGASLASDYIDFIIDAGDDLVAATDYQVVAVPFGCVDTILGSTVSRDIDIEFYRFAIGGAVSTTALQLITQFQMNQGTPGVLQSAVVGPFGGVVIQRNQQMLVRIRSNSGGNPLPPDQLRLTALRYRLIKV